MQTESRTWVVGAGEGEGRPACHGAQFQWQTDGGDKHNKMNALNTAQPLRKGSDGELSARALYRN